MVNKRLLIIGAVVAIIFGGAIFYLSFITGAEPPVEIMAARQDVYAGTRIKDIPVESFATIPLSGDELLLSSYLTETAWQQILAAGGVVVRDIYQYEAVPLSALASNGNPKVVDIPSLGLIDPNLVVVSLSNITVPSGIKVGDYVDLIVAVESSHQQVVSLVQPQILIETSGEFDTDAEITPSPEVSPTPTITPTPTLAPEYPLAKVIVRSAKIAGVQRDQNVVSSGDRIALGEITSVDVIIPREAQEFVLMSDTAGHLGLSLLSPMLDFETDEGPTLGAHFEDLLDLFVADRNELYEEE